MYEMKGSQIQIAPREFVDRFYKYKFDAHGLKFEKAYGDIAVSLKFHSTCFYPGADEPLYESIGLFNGTSARNSDCNIIIYTGDIKNISQRYRVFKDKETNIVHKNYDYIFTMNNGKELKFECHQYFDI